MSETGHRTGVCATTGQGTHYGRVTPDHAPSGHTGPFMRTCTRKTPSGYVVNVPLRVVRESRTLRNHMQEKDLAQDSEGVGGGNVL